MSCYYYRDYALRENNVSAPCGKSSDTYAANASALFFGKCIPQRSVALITVVVSGNDYVLGSECLMCWAVSVFFCEIRNIFRICRDRIYTSSNIRRECSPLGLHSLLPKTQCWIE